MVVDSQPLHPYKADILLFTLERFGAVPRERIIVQCTERVPTGMHHTLVRERLHGYERRSVPGRNLLQQDRATRLFHECDRARGRTGRERDISPGPRPRGPVSSRRSRPRSRMGKDRGRHESAAPDFGTHILRG